jgi:thiol-disulfide isomerase/thioredoxin
MTNYQMKKYIPYFLIIVGVVVFYWARYIRAPHVTFTEQLVDNTNPEADAIGAITGPAIVHFYASWCGPCMSEMKELNNLIPEYEKNGIQFVLVTDDSDDDVIALRMKYPNIEKIRQVPKLKDVGIYSIPATYWIDSSEQILEKNTGKNPWGVEQINKDIERFKQSK